MLWVTDGGAATSLIIGIDPTDGRMIDTPASLTSGLRSGSTIEQSSGLRLQLAHPTTYEPGRQERDVAVFDAETDSEIWAARVPGFLSALVFTETGDPMVMVIDQTGGTGIWSGSTDTPLSAYRPADGSLAWRRPLPRPALGAYRGKPGIVVTTSESEWLAISADDGATLWSIDHGSPGRQRPYTVGGRYRDIVYMSDLDAYVGLIVAERPYRD